MAQAIAGHLFSPQAHTPPLLPQWKRIALILTEVVITVLKGLAVSALLFIGLSLSIPILPISFEKILLIGLAVAVSSTALASLLHHFVPKLPKQAPLSPTALKVSSAKEEEDPLETTLPIPPLENPTVKTVPSPLCATLRMIASCEAARAYFLEKLRQKASQEPLRFQAPCESFEAMQESTPTKGILPSSFLPLLKKEQDPFNPSLVSDLLFFPEAPPPYPHLKETHAGVESPLQDPTLALPLESPSEPFQKLLDQFFTSERETGLVERSYSAPPPFLLITFNRFYEEEVKTQKSTAKIVRTKKKEVLVPALPLTLTLTEKQTLSSEPTSYDLMSFLVHQGQSLRAGLYLSYGQVQGQWVEYGGEKATLKTNEEILHILKTCTTTAHLYQKRQEIDSSLRASSPLSQQISPSSPVSVAFSVT